MCGITGLFEPSAPSWLANVTLAMTRIIRHRGPDGEGFAFYHPGQHEVTAVSSEQTPVGVAGQRAAPPGSILALGHRRLSILDLTVAGHQPMSDQHRDVWITFNGEIYNFAVLRAELESCGHFFHSGTDTEVIVAAWREWGESCLPRFNGMFALVLFDRRTRQVFAARDRFGVKPLYLWRTPAGGLAFVSEIKQLTAHPGWRARVNGQSVYDFLNWGISDHTAETMFAGVTQLRGGEYLLSHLESLSTAQPRRWYDLSPATFTGSFADASERFRELFEDSIRLRLRADVPVGSCLSGGLDSSSIVCTARAQLGDRAASVQRTFSAYSDTARFDERGFIETVNAATGAEARNITPDPVSLLSELSLLAWHQDEPFGSTSIYAQWSVFRLARASGVVVMLDGQGADESLGGYHGYFGPRLAGLLRSGRWLTFRSEAAAIRSLHGQTRRAQAKSIANELVPPWLADRLRGLAGRTVMSPPFLDLARLGAVPHMLHHGSVDWRDPVRSLSRSQLTALNLPMLLRYEDRDS
ncbi:MAG: asparagine synthase (glutamine-hydrolyzing), partial [Verrucomicrobiota bacterium]